MYFAWDWRGAERECRPAIELDPANADARERYGLLLSLEGRFGEALGQLHLAQSLDPLSSRTAWILASVLYWARRYDEGIAEARRILRNDPHYALAHYTLGQCYAEKGKLDEAIEEFLRYGKPTGNLGNAYARAGRKAEARKLRDLDNRNGINGMTAMIDIGLGEIDRAFAQLERGYERRAWLGTLKVAPVWDPLRSDVRFGRLLQRVGLTETIPSGR